MRFLVTGATGNVGREVIKDLMRTGEDVCAAVYEAQISQVEGAPALRFDFRDEATWGPALAGTTKVFLMRPPDMAGVEATRIPFLQQANAHGVQQITFL